MPRKRTRMPENYDKGFPSTLRTLMNEKGVTESELAEHIKKACNKEKLSRQAVSYYKDGSSSPDWETLTAIADFFGVSIDHLTGRTPDIKTSDVKIKSICEYTGLSEHAVRSLNKASKSKDGERTRLEGLSLLLSWSRGTVSSLNSKLEEAINAPDDFDAEELNRAFLEALETKCKETGMAIDAELRDLGAEVLYPGNRAEYWRQQVTATVLYIIENIRDLKIETEIEKQEG